MVVNLMFVKQPYPINFELNSRIHIDTANLISIESHHDHLFFAFKGQKEKLKVWNKTLESFNERLPQPNFQSIGRSETVNIYEIRRCDLETDMITMSNKDEFKVMPMERDEFFRILEKLIPDLFTDNKV